MKNHLVVIGLHWPEPESTAAGLRMLQLLELFQSLDYEITFLSAAPKTTHSYDLNRMGIQSQSITLNNDDFDTLITDLKPQVFSMIGLLPRSNLVGACMLVFQKP